MVSDEVIHYVKEQLKAGYSHEEIRDAILRQGWTEEEANDALSIGAQGLPPAVSPPVDFREPSNHGFYVSLLAGILMFVFGLEQLLSLELVPQFVEIFGFFTPLLGSELNAGAVIIIISIAVIMSSLVIRREGKGKLGGLLVLVFSVIMLIGFNGTLAMLAAILGIIGGILGLRMD